ncbi:MAG: phosphoribosylanthranilate isomerase [Rhodocyclaceae bacterium]|jgi:phosphoribosylanthranilate isomerase|nr:phosphoribosylanthranilate isomerase [Rhodocyclaceae bacterium]
MSLIATPRIKVCGLTRIEDVEAAVAAGVDAIGLVLYPESPRHVSIEHAVALCRHIPPFVTVVGLFVNASRAQVHRVIEAVPLNLLQFHGDETADQCEGFGLPYLRAARVRPGVDLLEFATQFPSARALLLDTWTPAYGGSGESFDWSLVPASCPLPVILSGGLNPGNVAEAIRQVRPVAVDVSSGVESAKGIKDAAKIRAFVSAVRGV